MKTFDSEKAWEELKRDYGEIVFKRESQKDTVRYNIELNILMNSYEEKYAYSKIAKEIKLVTDIRNIVYKKNTIFDIKAKTEHIEFSDYDICMLKKLEELKLLLSEKEVIQ